MTQTLKKQLRQKMLAKRDAIDIKKQIEYSIKACEHAKTLEVLYQEQNKIIAGYLPIKSEIDPRPLLHHLQKNNKQICLPVIHQQKLEFRQLCKNTKLQQAGFGTLGPDETAKIMQPQIMIIPLSVFDKTGGRIGYGKGYYDKAISELNKNIKPILIGMAFTQQQTQKVPMEKHDCYLHFIITQQGIIKP